MSGFLDLIVRCFSSTDFLWQTTRSRYAKSPTKRRLPSVHDTVKAVPVSTE